MRRWFVLVAAVVTLVAVPLATPALAGTEGSFVARMNAERTARGLSPLRVYADLTDDARAQSRRMMAAGEVFHNPSLGSVTSGWESLGENVGVGESVDALHRAFMASAAHRRNILGDFDYVGVGVAEEEGRIWVTVVFMKAAAELGAPATTTTVPASTTTTTTAPPPASTTTTTAAPPPAPTTTTTAAPPPASTTTTTTAAPAARVAAPAPTTTTPARVGRASSPAPSVPRPRLARLGWSSGPFVI